MLVCDCSLLRFVYARVSEFHTQAYHWPAEVRCRDRIVHGVVRVSWWVEHEDSLCRALEVGLAGISPLCVRLGCRGGVFGGGQLDFDMGEEERAGDKGYKH